MHYTHTYTHTYIHRCRAMPRVIQISKCVCAACVQLTGRVPKNHFHIYIHTHTHTYIHSQSGDSLTDDLGLLASRTGPFRAESGTSQPAFASTGGSLHAEPRSPAAFGMWGDPGTPACHTCKSVEEHVKQLQLESRGNVSCVCVYVCVCVCVFMYVCM